MTAIETKVDTSELVPLYAAVQNYAWGLSPSEGSLVARMYALNSGCGVEDEKPYSELWIGVHPSGPARIVSSPKLTLSQFLSNGSIPQIPYLFKILSVAKPLSIQAHPHKELAAQLHRDNPKAYKDDNHKPEMCVALTDFEGMCNFRPLSEVEAHLSEYSELAKLCGGEGNVEAMKTATCCEEKRAAFRNAFSALMTSEESAISDALSATLRVVKGKEDATSADSLFMRLCNYYPGDVGCFAAYLLNFMRIKPGQAFFMAANEPHAYLRGQCLEIMANSDNVVRAGLTPKFKDVPNLIDMLTYNDGPPEVMEGEKLDEYATRYQPPVDEFQLTKYVIPASEKHELKGAKGTGILLCVGGSGWIRVNERGSKKMPLAAGSIYYVPEKASMFVEADSSAVDGDSSPSLVFFRAGVKES